ncbi:MAG: hypothetical protein LBS89_09030 [Zoogloeaceae bacterium]|jgi:hypothetical protein|nr:hypothetical protein [Zoogloeaceae bacterium]
MKLNPVYQTVLNEVAAAIYQREEAEFHQLEGDLDLADKFRAGMSETERAIVAYLEDRISCLRARQPDFRAASLSPQSAQEVFP